MGIRSRLPVAHGPESRRHTPSATIVLSIGNVSGVSRVRVGSDFQDRERQEVATEPTWMSLWRVLAITTHPGSPPTFSGSGANSSILRISPVRHSTYVYVRLREWDTDSFLIENLVNTHQQIVANAATHFGMIDPG